MTSVSARDSRQESGRPWIASPSFSSKSASGKGADFRACRVDVLSRRSDEPGLIRTAPFCADDALTSRAPESPKSPLRKLRGHLFSESPQLMPWPVNRLLVSSCVMPAILSANALEGIDTVPADVVVNGDRAKVIEPETGRCLD